MFVNDAVIQRHAEDAGFLWSFRQRALRTNVLKHAARVRIDMRLEGNLDGLRFAGEAGWRAILAEAHAWPQPGSLFAAAVLGLNESEEAPIEDVLSLVGPEGSDLAPVVSAIGWSALDVVEPRLTRWIQSDEPMLRRLGVAGSVAHRRSEDPGILDALGSPCAAVRAVGAKAARELGDPAHASVLGDLLVDGDAEVRLQAALALARLRRSHPALEDALLALCDQSGSAAERAAAALVGLDRRRGHSLFRRWGRETRSRHLAAVAAEALGDAELVPTLIAWMDDDRASRRAGEAFRVITGTCLKNCRLARQRPDLVDGDPSDDPADERVQLDDHYDLAFPDRFKVAGWWRAHQRRFAPGTRYLDGKPVGLGSAPLAREHIENLRGIVQSGRPRNQTMAARVLGQALTTLPTVETHGPATKINALPGWQPWARLTVDETSSAWSRA